MMPGAIPDFGADVVATAAGGKIVQESVIVAVKAKADVPAARPILVPQPGAFPGKGLHPDRNGEVVGIDLLQTSQGDGPIGRLSGALIVDECRRLSENPGIVFGRT